MIFETIGADGRMPGATGKMFSSHVFFSSNSAFVKSEFSPVCLKRLEDALTGRNS
jgi:hypothetical protein